MNDPVDFGEKGAGDVSKESKVWFTVRHTMLNILLFWVNKAYLEFFSILRFLEALFVIFGILVYWVVFVFRIVSPDMLVCWVILWALLHMG